MGPTWEAGLILTLADKTGWTEDAILDLPMTRALAYYHAALWAAGAWTVRPGPAPTEQLFRLMAFCENDLAEAE